MLLMVFVNDLWSVGGVPHFLEHFEAFEDGMGVADVVFPMFLFAMGMSIPYAIERRFAKGCTGESTLGHILSRTFALVLMGVFIVNSESKFTSTVGYGLDLYRLLMVAAFFLIWNQYRVENKLKKWLQVVGVAILVFLAVTYRAVDGGGICRPVGGAYWESSAGHIISAPSYICWRRKPFRILLVWIGLCVVNLLVTRMRSGELLLSGQSLLTDLTGVLRLGNCSFAVMATGGMLIAMAENHISSRTSALRTAMALSLAAFVAVVALILHNWWTVSKLIGTLPWCLYVMAVSITLYVLLRILEVNRMTGWFRFLSASGTATLTVYMMPYVLYSINDYLGLYTYGSLTGALGLLKCAAFSLLCVGITSLLVRLGLKLKV